MPCRVPVLPQGWGLMTLDPEKPSLPATHWHHVSWVLLYVVGVLCLFVRFNIVLTQNGG
jgi:hypothetical protein